MKYGIIDGNYGAHAAALGGFNLGDVVQYLALKQIYQYMGIPQEEILHIPLCDVADYCGEYVLLPLCGMALGIGYAPLPLSPQIIPVFISAHIAKAEFTPEAVAYLRTYEPIGCRDELSLETMRRYHIQAYLSGCITTIFPRREKEPSDGKVLLIDTPESLEPFLPEVICKNAERLTHLLPIPQKAMTQQEADQLYQKTVERLEYYHDNATLVISSRLHALVPCMAMGIPVIGAFENISYRFSWLDKFIKLYSPSNFSEINWNPNAIAYERRKQQFMELFSSQIKTAYEKYALLYDVSDFYEKRDKARYGNHYTDCIHKMRAYMPDAFSYLIWGCGLIGETVFKTMQEEFPSAKLLAAVDNFVEGMWHGVPVIKPSALCCYSDSFVILATYSGRYECRARMEELGRVENKDFIYVATQNG